MNQKQFLLTLLLAVISAFLGGALGVWFLMPQSVLAQPSPQNVITPQEFEIVHAREFRVVDGDGNIEAVLREVEGQPDLRLFDDNNNTRAALSLDQSSVPSLRLFDANGKERATLNLVRSVIGEEIARLALHQADAEVLDGFKATPDTLQLGRWEHKIVLRAGREEELSYGLYIVRPEASVVLGVSGEDGSHLNLFRGDNQGFNVKLTAGAAGTQIAITDAYGSEKAVLGNLTLKNNRTGSTEIRNVASIVLIDEEGNVVWSAP